MKTITGFLYIVLLGFASAVYAADNATEEVYVPHIPVEVPANKIKLSNDGTGIVKDVSCEGCDYKILKVTKNSKAYANSVLTDMVRVRAKKEGLVLVKYIRATGEVYEVRWFE